MNTTPENHFEVGESNTRAGLNVEYRVRPITRYIVTRHVDTGNTGSTTERGQFDNYQTAYDVAYAMCKLEHDVAGTESGDPGFQYPKTGGGDSLASYVRNCEIVARPGDDPLFVHDARGVTARLDGYRISPIDS